MSKKIIAVVLFILSLSTYTSAQVQLGIGVPENVFVANATAAPQTGTVYAIPASGNIISWVVTYGSAPASVTVVLEFSNDNSTWATGDTSTAVAGETRTVFNASKFVRATESARSGGGAITLTITAKTGPIANLNTVGTSGQILAGNGTALLPTYSYSASPTTGLYLFASNLPAMSVSGVPRAAWGSGYFLDSTYPIAWTSGLMGTSADLGLSRLSAGALGIGTGAAGSVAGTVQAAAFDTTAGGFLSSGGQFKIGNGGASGIGVFTNNAISNGSTIKVDALPTVSSGFGTSPSVTAGSTPFAGSVNVGTGGVATSGIVLFNGTAFPSAPFCITIANQGAGVQLASASTTQINISSAAAWPASTVIAWHCIGAK